MTDQELNEAVARKLGWTRTNTGTWLREGIYHHDEPGKDLPSYASEIAAAWELTERLNIFALVREGSGEERWIASYTDSDDQEYAGIAATAPRAICEAFLKLP